MKNHLVSCRYVALCVCSGRLNLVIVFVVVVVVVAVVVVVEWVHNCVSIRYMSFKYIRRAPSSNSNVVSSYICDQKEKKHLCW